MKFIVCRHIKTNGKRCKSPALRGNDLCYFHTRFFQRQNVFFGPPATQSDPAIPSYPPSNWPIELDLPVLEDAESIQIALSLTVAALGRNRIDIKRANSLIYGLRAAALNAKRIITEPLPENVTCDIVPGGFDTHLAAPDPSAAPDLDGIPQPDQPSDSSIHSNFSFSGGVIQEGVPEAK